MTRKTASTRAANVRKTPKKGEKQIEKSSFPIIGLGASAGGLEAFEVFFKKVPADSGMAFILVSHLDPGHASMLAEILQRISAVPVVEAANQMTVEPDHVYIIPPNREMTLFHRELQLSMPSQMRGRRMPIDTFLSSLAEDEGEKAIAVILSGSGTDGTLGLQAVLGAGGVSFVQDPATAKYGGMPTSAIQSGLATYVLPVEKMFGKIAAYVRNYSSRKIPPPLPLPEGKLPYAKILMLLRTKTGHDFSLYKQNMIRRRIERRMGMHNLEDPDEYARFLTLNPSEVHLLFKELLLNVTSFFRDPEAFEVLKTEVIPSMFQNKPENYVFRVWVVGCATGEEAYSVAMIFHECMETAQHQYKVQIYSTDIDEDAIAVARGGVYPANIANDVSPERLRRFFTRDETGFRIKKEIREMIVFAVQDVIKDPPFTRLDLLSCRNLLIYFEPELQNRLIPSFNYTLNPGGILFLSPSESIGKFTDLFSPVSRKWKIFSTRKLLSPARMAGIDQQPVFTNQTDRSTPEPATKQRETNFVELTRGILLQSYAPPTVITDNEGNTLYVHGDTGNYLRPAPGQASLNIIEMAREGLQLKLGRAIRDAVKQKKPVTIRGLHFRFQGQTHPVDIIVRPLTDPNTARELLIVSFLESRPEEPEKPQRKKAVRDEESKRVEELEQELRYTKENLQENLIQMQAANEELKSANEELQSTNEELQSTNEELETSKEELQSVNEEIVTVNAELQAKIEQLTDTQNDMKNLLDSTSIGTIFLDGNLVVKRFTRDAARVFRLVATDAGRPLSDIKSSIVAEDIITDAQEVLDTMVPKEHEVQTSENMWYLARLTPYRTLENVIDGVVITFTDITAIKSMEKEIRRARELAENIIDTVRESLVVLDPEFRIVSASRTFYSTFRTSPDETTGRSLFELGNRQWDIPKLRELLETVLPNDTSFEDIEVNHEFPGIGFRKMLLNGRRVLSDDGKPRFILLAMEDITYRTSIPRTIKKGRGEGRGA